MRNPTLAENVRILAAKNRMSQSALAREAGVSQATVSRIFSGDTGCRVDSVVKVAEALGVTMSALFAELVQEQEKAA